MLPNRFRRRDGSRACATLKLRQQPNVSKWRRCALFIYVDGSAVCDPCPTRGSSDARHAKPTKERTRPGAAAPLFVRHGWLTLSTVLRRRTLDSRACNALRYFHRFFGQLFLIFHREESFVTRGPNCVCFGRYWSRNHGSRDREQSELKTWNLDSNYLVST